MIDKAMPLKDRAKRIVEIDGELSRLFKELHALYREGLTQKEINLLFDLVRHDGSGHWL